MIFFMLLIDYEVDVFLQELIGQAVERLRKLYVLFLQLTHGFGNASSYVVEFRALLVGTDNYQKSIEGSEWGKG